MAAYISGIMKLYSQFITEYSSPDFAPIISAATSTIMEWEALSLTPVIIEGREEGRTTFFKMETSE